MLKDKWLIEGIVGLQFGDVTAIEFSPMIGYKLTDDFVSGIGFTYEYSKYNDFYMDTETGSLSDRKLNILGGRIFGRYYLSNWLEDILEGLFVHAEFEYLSYTINYQVDANGKFVDVFGVPYSPGKQSVNVPGLLVGGGLSQPIGGRAFANILILYNLNESNETPYRNPVIRIGFGYGF
ncbi:MAG: hypothetical protein EOM06_02195 [Sphingobacteriia bacterium]|nr:hypothetical protein [Sphingobacteriia bacterium]